MPTWNTDSTLAEEEINIDSTPVTPPSDINAAWPAQAHYVPPSPGSRTIRLIGQPAPLTTLIKAAIRVVVGDALFLDAYPPVSCSDDYFRGVLTQLGQELELHALLDRLSIDRVLFDHVCRLVWICIIPFLFTTNAIFF